MATAPCCDGECRDGERVDSGAQNASHCMRQDRIQPELSAALRRVSIVDMSKHSKIPSEPSVRVSSSAKTPHEDDLAFHLRLGSDAENVVGFAYALALAVQDFLHLGIAPTLPQGGRYRDVAGQMIEKLSRKPPRATIEEVAAFLRAFLRAAMPTELPRARHAEAETYDERLAADRQFERDLFETQWADGSGDDGDSPRYLRIGLWRDLAAKIGRIPFNNRFVLPSERRDPLNDLRALLRELRALRDAKVQDGFAHLSPAGEDAFYASAPTPTPEPLRRLFADSGRATIAVVDEAIRWIHDLVRSTEVACGRKATSSAKELDPSRDFPAQAPTSPVPLATANLMRNDGVTWTVAFEGVSKTVPSSKGMSYIATLVAHAHKQIAALVLARALPDDRPKRVTGDEGDDQPPQADSSACLDANEIADYRDQLARLRKDLAEAGAQNDESRAERARRDIAAVERVLATDCGIDGRPRRSDAAVEKSRKAVSRAIDRAKSQIRSEFKALAEHLDRHIKTGTLCAYNGDATWTQVSSLPVR